MKCEGCEIIPASVAEVWDALQNPDILKQCIEGCEEVTQTSKYEFEATVTAKIGPVRATFSSTIQMTDVEELKQYTLRVAAKSSSAGFGQGNAHVRLVDQGDSTKLAFRAQGTVGGRLAQLGSRLISGVSNKMASQFFANFASRWGTQN